MQAIHEEIRPSEGSGFSAKRFVATGWSFVWHQHPEHELTLIESGRGTRFVGDSMEAFEPGEVVLLASNVPHTWQAERKRRPWCGSVVVQFRDDAAGPGFFDLPEMRPVRGLLGLAQRGLAFPSSVGGSVAGLLARMPEMSPHRRLVGLMEALSLLAELPWVALASDRPAAALRPQERARLDTACRYLHQHFAEPITLDDVAEAVHLTGPAFCRFFHRAMGRSFVGYVHELRVARACLLLQETDLAITEVCYRCGFGNLSNFNRVFRRLRGRTPREMRAGR